MPGATSPGGPGGVPAGLPGPYTLGYETIRDVTAWQLWWEFNRDAYLGLSSIDTRGAATGSADFFLGIGQRRIPGPGGRASTEIVGQRIIPILTTVIQSGGKLGLLSETIVAAAKAGSRTNASGLQTSLRWFIEKNEFPQIRRTAALAFGIMGSQRGIDPLRALAYDTPAGRDMVSGDVVEADLRASAIYGLALLASQASPRELSDMVRGMVALIENQDTPDDLRVAATLALGFMPLAPSGDTVCNCGTCEVPAPHNSLEAQVTWLVRLFMEQRSESRSVRAQAAGSLARLLSSRPKDAPTKLKEVVADVLIKALDRESRQPAVVRESAALGLAMIGDADDDAIDQWIRWALDRSVRTGGRLEKRFALIGMGLIGSRPGNDDETTWDGTRDMRRRLLHQLGRGRKDLRPWAAMGLGVMGHWLTANGQVMSSEVDLALRTAVRNSRRADLGAYALALGMRRDPGAVEVLMKKLAKERDPEAQSYAALALGMIGDHQAKEILQAKLHGERTPPVLRSKAGLALGLLGDATVVEKLVGMLAEREDADSRQAVTRALGGIGDVRSIDALDAEFRNIEEGAAVRTEVAIALGRLADSRPLSWRAILATGTNYHGAPATLTSPDGTGVLDLH